MAEQAQTADVPWIPDEELQEYLARFIPDLSPLSDPSPEQAERRRRAERLALDIRLESLYRPPYRPNVFGVITGL